MAADRFCRLGGRVKNLAIRAKDWSDTIPMSRLGAMIKPTTIGWIITKTIVNSFKRHAFRALSHVRQKVGKIIPLFADSNASTTIVLIVRVPRPLTSSPHGAPTQIGRAYSSLSANSQGVTVLFGARTATTRNRLATTKISNANDFRISTVAAAFPASLPPFDIMNFKRSQKTETLASYVAWIRHTASYWLCSYPSTQMSGTWA